MIRVVVVDDHYLVRQGVRTLLDEAAGIDVVGEARDGEEALELVDDVHPDVVVMDISMPQMDGIMATEELQNREPAPRVVILSMYTDADLVEQAVRSGASGYLLKRSTTKDLIDAVRSARKGDLFLGSGVRRDGPRSDQKSRVATRKRVG